MGTVHRLVQIGCLGITIARWTVDPDVRAATFSDGSTAFVLSRNMDGRPFAWRVTRLDVATGEPIGHSYGASADAALHAGLWHGAQLVNVTHRKAALAA